MVDEDQLVAVTEVYFSSHGCCQKVKQVDNWGSNDRVLEVDLKLENNGLDKIDQERGQNFSQRVHPLAVRSRI